MAEEQEQQFASQEELDNSYSDAEEFQDNFQDEQRDLWEQQGGAYPSANKPESLYGLFKSVWNTKNSTKVGNLDKGELGFPLYSVRDAQRIALLATTLHHKQFGDHFLSMAEINLASSMSKNGWFVELFVSTKKFAHKGVSNLPQLNQPAGQQAKSGWKNLFSK